PPPAAAPPAAAYAAPAEAAPAGGAESTPCPSCGHPVQAGFRFCGACGARMAPAAPAPATSGGRTMFMGPQHAPVAPQPRGKLVLIRPDGTEGGTLPLAEGETLVGRGLGAMFDGDAYLSPRHAQFVLNAAGLVVRDLHSLNGVFLKLGDEEEIGSGTIFRIGQELLRFDTIQPPLPLEDGTEVMGSPNPGFWGRLVVIVGRDVDGSAFPLFGDAVVLGRERGDILFPEDGYVSGTHARISFRDGRVYLADLGSSNGTFLRALGERPVASGSFLLMGQQLFKVSYT
ncbi:MAG: FHA domain-containing protein, partial [Deltaproteobacteria bacterium]|nr:FHA domain-containing protein [Deltaproteobacteria bacterium]